MIKFLWMAPNCYAATARLEIFMDKNFMGAPKTTKSTKILILEIFRLYNIFYRQVLQAGGRNSQSNHTNHFDID